MWGEEETKGREDFLKEPSNCKDPGCGVTGMWTSITMFSQK